MKLRPYIISFFSLLTLVAFQGCGVDPLETGDKFGTTTCEKTGLQDSDNDGLSDECEKLIGSDAFDGDSNDNGIGDKKDPPPPPSPPPSQPNFNCADNVYSSQAEQYYCELNGVRRGNVEEEARSAQLADSALNGKAPNGTVIQVQEQKIRIVNNGTGLGSSNAALQAFCLDDQDQPMTSFIYYKVVGTVKYCEASSDETEVQNCEGTPQATQLELCGPLNHPSIANPNTGVDIVIENFKWTSGKTLKGLFKPRSMVKNETVNPILTLTPSDLQSVGGGVYKKVKLKFNRTFDIEGRVKKTYTTTDGRVMEEVQYIETVGNLETMRNFKRASTDGVIDANYATQYPKMLGPFHAGE